MIFLINPYDICQLLNRLWGLIYFDLKGIWDSKWGKRSRGHIRLVFCKPVEYKH